MRTRCQIKLYEPKTGLLLARHALNAVINGGKRITFLHSKGDYTDECTNYQDSELN